MKDEIKIHENSVESEIISENKPQDLRSGDALQKREQFNAAYYEDHIKSEKEFQARMASMSMPVEAEDNDEDDN